MIQGKSCDPKDQRLDPPIEGWKYRRGTWRMGSQVSYVVHNHGDRFRPPRIGLWDPFQMAELHGLQMEGS